MPSPCPAGSSRSAAARSCRQRTAPPSSRPGSSSTCAPRRRPWRAGWTVPPTGRCSTPATVSAASATCWSPAALSMRPPATSPSTPTAAASSRSPRRCRSGTSAASARWQAGDALTAWSTAAATVPVVTPTRTYPVLVGRGLLDRLDELLPELPGATVAALVHPRALAPLAWQAGQALSSRGLEVHALEVPDGEDAKRLAVVSDLYQRLAAIPAHRPDPLVALGGGATTDVAGFTAATWLRGVPLVNLPTTLLGMVDAAIGGKTAVDLPAGKNLAGAFHQPVAVAADLDTLASLPAAELRSGMAEVIKAGLIADPALAAACGRNASEAIGEPPDLDALAPLVEAAIRVKAAVVSSDERAAGLPVGGTDLDPDAILDAMATDKKTTGGGLRLVLLREVGRAELLPAPPRAVLVEAIRALAEEPK